MKLEKYSIGIGDRFGHQGTAQLQALVKAQEKGVQITPVWNKSFREHEIIGTHPDDARKEADEAVSECSWKASYFVDADHIGLKNVDLFMNASNFFTLDVADFIGQSEDDDAIESFFQDHRQYLGELMIPGIKEPFHISEEMIRAIARKFLKGVKEAGRIYNHIASQKDTPFVVEVSMDETDDPQTPVELFFILAAIAGEKIPAQTIAPKFTGRFNKGVDYIGDKSQFAKEFEQDLAVIAFAVQEFGLPSNLKLSIHSGSDKFALYPLIKKAIHQFDAGLHLKTAGTTWLEELIGLAEAEDEGLEIAREIYRSALNRYDELCRPYATVIDIDRALLPDAGDVDTWNGDRFARVLRHNQQEAAYNMHFRQLLHVGYKIAAEMGNRYLDALRKFETSIARNVTENLYERHIKSLFL